MRCKQCLEHAFLPFFEILLPKDAATIVTLGDISPGARVIEAGAGSGALSIAILERIGPAGSLTSYERRTEFAENAKSNVDGKVGVDGIKYFSGFAVKP